MLQRFAGTFGAVVALIMLCGGALASDLQTELVAKGLQLAETRCARCHALDLTSASPHPKAPPFRLVVERYPSENLAEALAEGIVSGHPDMPVFVFPPAEIEAFLAFLDSLETPKPAKRGGRGRGEGCAATSAVRVRGRRRHSQRNCPAVHRSPRPLS